MITAFVAAFASGGVRPAAIAAAFGLLEAIDDIEIVGVSRIYEYLVPMDGPPVAAAVARLETTVSAENIIGWLGDIMRDVPDDTGPASAVRLELLLYGDEEWSSAAIVIPAPGLFERDSVVTPLLEVAPDAKLPDGSYLHPDTVRTEHVVRELGPVPGFEGRRAVLADRLADESAARRAEARRAGIADTDGEDTWPPLDEGDTWETLLAVTETSSWAWVRVMQGVIRASGIPCVQTGTLAGDRIGLWIPGAEPVRLLVPKSRLAEAHGLLDRTRAQAPMDPSDGGHWESDDINVPTTSPYATMTRGHASQRPDLSPMAKRIGWALLAAAFVLVTMWGGWSR